MGRFKALVCCTAMALLAMTGARAPVQAGVMNPIPGDPITIESGRLSGTLLDSGVKAYLGVPFAAPPVPGRSAVRSGSTRGLRSTAIGYACSWRKRSASSAAMQPEPAAVIA